MVGNGHRRLTFRCVWSVLRCLPADRTGRLLLCVLVSGLLHVLVIVFPYLGKTMGGGGRISTGEYLSRPFLRATLSYSPRGLQAALAPATVPQKVFEQEYGQKGPIAPFLPEVFPETKLSEGVNVLPLPGTTYYPTAVLSVKPRPLGELALDHDRIAGAVASGKIILDLWISEHGDVTNTVIESNDLPEAVLQVVEKAFRKLHFSPGELNGLKVGSVMRIEVTYDDFRSPSSDEPQ